MLELLARSLVDTHAVAGALAALVRPGDVVVLAGEMGAGKTAFAQAFAAALGVTEPVTSPTYTLVHTYDTGRVPVHHADLYRLGSHARGRRPRTPRRAGGGARCAARRVG